MGWAGLQGGVGGWGRRAERGNKVAIGEAHQNPGLQDGCSAARAAMATRCPIAQPPAHPGLVSADIVEDPDSDKLRDKAAADVTAIGRRPRDRSETICE